jgi:glutathione S-transferase
MITVHHLNNSRSQRILWLLEELGVPYQVKHYQRDAVTRLAPPELKAVHPLGKSPVIEDDGVKVAESAAIVDYLVRKYGKDKFQPAENSPDYVAYQQWLHFAEGSAMLPFLLSLYVGRLGEAGAPLQPRINSEILNHLGYMNQSLGNNDWFVANKLSGADFMLSFVADILQGRGMLDAFPNLKRFAEKIQARPAWKKALEKGGPYTMGR